MADEIKNPFSEEDLENLREALDYSRVLVDNARQLYELNRKGSYILFRNLRDATFQLNKHLEKVNLNYNKYLNLEIKQKEALKDLAAIENYRNQLIDKRKILEEDILTSKIKELQAAKKLEDEAHNKLNKMGASAGKKYKEVKELYQKRKEETAELETQVELITESVDLSKKLEETAETQMKDLESYAKNWEKATLKMGLAGRLFKGLSKIPLVGELFNAQAAMDKMQKSTLMNKGFWSSLGGGISAAFSGIAMATGILLAIDLIIKGIKFVLDAMFGASKQIAEIARMMTLSREEAAKVRDNLFASAQHARELAIIGQGNLVTQKQTYETFVLINKQLGSAVQFSSDFVVQMTAAKELIGLSEEAMRGLTLYTQAGLKSAQAIEMSILSTNEQLKFEGKSIIENNKLLNLVLKTSGYIRSAFKGNVEELTKATVQAFQMGTNLEKVFALSEGFLNFESSISAELEAQLLTGRDINLNAARYYALTNDQHGLMKEMQKNFPTWQEFNKLNRIAADGMAKALGLSRDELSNMIFEQQTLNRLTKVGAGIMGERLSKENKLKLEQAKTTEEAFQILKGAGANMQLLREEVGKMALERLQTTDAQTRFNQALEVTKEAFTRLVEGGALEKLADLATALANALSGGVSGLFKLDEEYEKARIQRAQQIAEQDAEFKKDMNIYAYDGVKYDFEKLDQLIMERDKKLNQPQQDFISRGDTITPFRKDDLIIGGTNLMGNNETLVKKIDELISVVREGKNIYLDSYKTGEAITLGSLKPQ